MTRFYAAILFGLCLGLCWPGTGWAQDSEPTDRCFPWQEFHDGVCAAKSTPIAPAQPTPGPPPVAAETSAAPPPLVCPPNSHVEGGGTCIIDAAPPPASPRAPITVACNDSAASDRRCICPAGFQLMSTGTDPVGTCVRPHADNCLGGQMTVDGQCLCIGQVTMSGQVYDLEFAHGKCVPKRCPRDGPCATAAVNSNADPLPKLPAEERPPARHRSHPAYPNSYFRLVPNYPGPMHY